MKTADNPKQKRQPATTHHTDEPLLEVVHQTEQPKQMKVLDSTVADAQTYDELEKTFERVLSELGPDPRLGKFKEQYKKVLQAVRRSHDNEKRLAVKCKQLNEDLVDAGARVSAAFRLGQEDQITIVTLRKELEKNWKQIDGHHDKEGKLREDLEDMKLELERMTQQAEENKEHDAAIDDLLKHKQELLQERDNQMTEILALRRDDESLRSQLHAVEMQKGEVEASLEAVRLDAASKKADQDSDMRKREKLEKEVHELKMSLEARQVELKSRAAEAQTAENMIKDYERQIRDVHMASNRVNKECNDLINHANRLQRELDGKHAQVAQLSSENESRSAALKQANSTLQASKQENGKLQRSIDSGASKLRVTEERLSALEQFRDDLRAKVLLLEREKEGQQRNVSLLESKLTMLQHEKDALTKLKAQAEGSSHHQMDLVRVHEGHMRVLEGELSNQRAAIQDAGQRESALVRQHEAMALETKQLNEKLGDAQNELEVKAKEAAEIRTQIEEREAAVKSQQKSYDQVRAERNVYSRDLIAAQAEVAEAKRRLTMMTHQLEIMRSDIKTKDAAHMSEKFAHTKANNERQSLATELSNAQKSVSDTSKEAATLRDEIRRMNSLVELADQERERQRKEYDTLAASRDVLGTQLVRRNDEVALLYAKLRLQTSSLQAGQAAYRDRLAEVRVVKARVLALHKEVTLARRQGAAADELKRELIFLNKKLLYEQAKTKALSEELETPLNVHRWRQLEGSDLATYELIQKVQLLQHRLIRASKKVVERDLQIKEKEQLCQELQAIVNRMPGPEASEQLAITQANVREKTKQLQALKGELDMRHAQVDDYKISIKRMQTEINALKGHFLTQKRLYVTGQFQPSPDESVASSTYIDEMFAQAEDNVHTPDAIAVA